MTLASISIVLNAERQKDLGKMKAGLNPQILMVGFSGILNIGQAEGLQMMKERFLYVKAL